MRTIHVYDPALCCSSGICGADVDQVLVDFSAAIKQVSNDGVEVIRHNLASDPAAFAASAPVKKFLEVSGPDALPAIVVDDVIALSGTYPTAEQLMTFAGLSQEGSEEGASQALPISEQTGGCCCGGSC